MVSRLPELKPVKRLAKPPAEIPDIPEEDISSLLRKVIPEGEPSLVLEWAETNLEAFAKILRESPERDAARALEQQLFEPAAPPIEVPPPGALAFEPIAPGVPLSAIGQVIFPEESYEAYKRAFPGRRTFRSPHLTGEQEARLNIRRLIEEINEDPEPFMRDLLAVGRTPDTDLLLRSLGLDTATIDEIFPPLPPEVRDVQFETESGEVVNLEIKRDGSVWQRDMVIPNIPADIPIRIGHIDPATGMLVPLSDDEMWEQLFALEPKGEEFGKEGFTLPLGFYRLMSDQPWLALAFEYGIKGLNTIFEPFAQAGTALRALHRIADPEQKKELTALRNERREELLARLAEAKTDNERQAIFREEAQKAKEAFQLGGELREEFEALPWYQKLAYETPAFLTTGGLSATGLRSILAGISAKGVALPTRVGIEAARVALAPVAGVEAVTGLGLRGVKFITFDLPVKGVTAGGKRAFQLALDQGLDRTLSRIGREIPAGTTKEKFVKAIFDKFLTPENKIKLTELATKNLVKRQAEAKAKGQSVESATKLAVDDTLKELEPLLLKAAKDVRVKAPPEAVVKAPPPKAVVPKAEVPAVKKPAPEITKAEEIAREVGEMEAEVAGLKETLETDPVAVESFKSGSKNVGLEAFVSIKEQSFPETFTVKQAEALFPGGNFSRYTQKGTPQFNKVPRDAALDDLTKQFNMTPDEIADRVMAIRGERVRIKKLVAEIPALEAEVAIEKLPPVETKAVTSELQSIVSDLSTEVGSAQVALKGKTGEEARVGRTALTGLERELKVAESTLQTFQEQINVPDAAKLRSTVMAMSKMKGISKTQLQSIIKEVSGKKQLRNIASPQLIEILGKVREARPVRIKGTKVVTLKTEKKIQSLKENLISSRQLTSEIYNKIMERLNLRTDRYETARKFISETDAKELIRSMNDEVPLAEWDIKVEDALAKKPTVKEARDVLNQRGFKGTGVEFDDKPIKIGRGEELRSMRYYMLNLQKKLSAPVYDTWQKINNAHLIARDRHNRQIARLEQTTPNFKEVVADDVALKRIEDYIASKQKLAKIKAPELSEDELAIATELERGFFESEDRVRFARFTNSYAENEGDIDLVAKEIPNAPKKALRRAIDIYEGKGADALRKFTDTQKWGVITGGYDPRSFIKPIIYSRAPKETTFAKGFLRSRTGVEYQSDDTNIIHRYSRHQRQLIALEEMSALIRAFGRLYADNASKLDPASQRNVARVMSKGFNEMKGYREDGGAIVHAIERLYGQVAAAVFWRPDLVARNKFQNFAFNPDYWAGRFLDPRNKPISDDRRRWFEVFVSQERVFQFDFLMYGEKPLPGFGRITKLARNTSLYPWSDKSNRAEAFYVRINRVDRALAQYEKDGDVTKLINDSGLAEFEPRQQAEALELLAMDSVEYGIEGMTAVSGEEAFALYSTQQLVNNVHFLYDRPQRSPAEMGATGKTLGNILVFSRSWGERFLLQAQKLDPKVKATTQERITAVKVIVGIIVSGLLAGEAYKEITGKDRNPYNPLNIITWAPGGLALGVTEDISNTIYLMTQAMKGDKSAFARLPSVISGVATLTLPFYKNAIQALDAITDMKGVDVFVIRKIREMIDDEYEIRGGVHEVERTLLEKLQRAIFSLKDEPVTPQEKVKEAEKQLGQSVDVSDKAFNLEEPEMYGLGKLFSRFSQILGNVKPEDITKENKYTELAVAWKDREGYEDIWETLPNKKLFEITELPEELTKWAERHKRQLALVTKYQRLEGAEQKAFLEEHPELKENPAIEWLKKFPIANAHLALNGQVKIYSLEAYEEFNRLIKDLDIPEDAIPPLTLPPKGSVENYFKYLDEIAETSPNSWETQLLLSQDDDLREFLERQPITAPVESLELKVKHRALFNQYDALETDEAREKLKADNPEWVDDMRRIEAIENGALDYIPREKVIPRSKFQDLIKFMEFAKSTHQQDFIRTLPQDEREWHKKWVENYTTIQEVFKEVREGIISEDKIKKAITLLTEDIKLDADQSVRLERKAIKAREAGDEALANENTRKMRFYRDAVQKFLEAKELLASVIKTPQDIAQDIVESWVERGQIVDETGASSSASKTWLAFHLETYRWALENELLTDDGGFPDDDPYIIENGRHSEKWNIPVLRITSRWHEEDEAYNALETNTERQQYLLGNEDYRKDRRRREAFGDDFPEALIEDFVEYWELPVTGYRQERFLMDNKPFGEAMALSKGIEIPDQIPAVQYDELTELWQDEFNEIEGLSDRESRFFVEDPDKRDEARDAMRFRDGKLTLFGKAEIEREAYYKFVPEKHIQSYVGYYSLLAEGKPDTWPEDESWYEDDWFLIENRDFYKEVYLGILKNDRKDYRKVPTREVYKKYLVYQGLPEGKRRDDYRFDNLDLDAWLVRKFGYVSITEQKRREELTPREEMAEREKEFEESLEELRGGVKPLPEELEEKLKALKGGEGDFGQDEEATDEGMTTADWKKEYAKGTPHWAEDMKPSVFAKEFVGKMKSNKAKDILEIGSGNGRDSIHFAKAGFNVTSIDITPKAVELAEKNAKKEKAEVNFRVANAEKLPFDDNSFDAVFTLSVLHSTELKESIPEVYRVLRPNGLAFIYIYGDTQFKDRKPKEGVVDYDEYLMDLKGFGFKILDSYKEQEDKFDENGEKHHIFVVTLQKVGESR
jgi:ubiquinone/menaquinone biosynthesis C-methylase UbiE